MSLLNENQKRALKEQISQVVNETLLTEKEKDGNYQKFFKDMLDIFGVDGPDEIPKKHREKFFNFIDNGWDSRDDEVDSSALDNAKKYVKQNNIKESRISSTSIIKRIVQEQMDQNGISRKQAIKNVLMSLKKLGKI